MDRVEQLPGDHSTQQRGMKKILIAITSCHKRADFCQYQRGAWISKLPQGTLSRFFYGRPGSNPRPFYFPDEVDLNVPDDYANLSFKVRGMVTWAYQHGFDYMLKVDDDTYVFPERLAALKRFDYAGEARSFDGLGASICSGGGYWLSRKAMKALIESPRESQYKYHHGSVSGPRLMQEDWWVASVMKKAGIKAINVPGIGSRAKVTDPRRVVWEYPGLAMVREHRRHYPLQFKLNYQEF